MIDKSITTIQDWLSRATSQLTRADIPSARLDAELILSHTLREPRTWLHSHHDEPLESRQLEIANARLDLRLDRVPVAYIIGHKEFYGHPFKVTTATLIPRPESETLIELLDEALPKNERLIVDRPLRLVDVGTGSGNLGITAKLAHPELEVTLVDISRHALNVAEENAEALHAEVDTVQSDLLTSYPFVADVIIANLPYVDIEWERSPETNHEPDSALFAPNNGLALIFELLIQTKEKLTLGGKLILEADPEQHKAIIKEAAIYGFVLHEQRDYGLLLDKLA
ncbi:protein-(glutamine-N5) methyltransferase, release factor-specific [Candidatus Saccharibacteria bacterium 49-20]|nr:MAG: protein-(glutamine-N5) methyltransferase, release factor-specific [Candidatus Saccharibacteria bacterium 49-20]